ncbi:MAG: aspartate/glutamate racemase family protein [Candidatus Competibacterales bacterium]
MYGWRGRIGLLTPTGNATLEAEFQRMVPDGVSVHANRIYLKEVTPEALPAMEAEVATGVQGLVDCRLGALAFGCTSGSFVGGKGYDARLIQQMEELSGIPATTTTTAVLRALETLGVERFAMATPYTDAVNAIERQFFCDHGFEVTAVAGGGITVTADIQELDPRVAYRRARQVDSDRAEAVFISCTGFRTIDVIEALEADLGKPVISANQATLADCLRLLGVGDVQPGYGSLFSRWLSAPEDHSRRDILHAGRRALT